MKKLLVILLAICLFATASGVAMAQQVVPVRAGIHERSNRLVFDWMQRTDYTYSQQGNQVTIQFNKEASANLAQALRVKTQYIRNIVQEKNDKGLVVRFIIPDNARVAPFRLGTKIAFDVIVAEQRPPQFGGKPQPPKTEQQKAEAEKPSPATEAAKTVAQSAGIEAVNKAELDKPVAAEEKTAAAATPPAAPVQAAATGQQEESEAKILPPPSSMEEPKPAPEQASPNQPRRLLTLADRLAGMTDEAEEAAKQQTAKQELDGTVIRLDPGEYTKLAVFLRAGKLWIVLNKPLKNFMPEIEGVHLEHFSKNARRIDQSKSTSFVLPAPPEGKEPARYSIRREKTQWQIWIGSKDKTYLPEDMPVNVVDDTTTQQTHLSLYAGEDPTLIRLQDSSTGERFWVIPVHTPEGRVAQSRRAPGYHLPPTLMGAVVVFTDDNMTLAPSKDMVLLYSTGGNKILLSSPDDRKRGLEEARYLPLFRLTIPELADKKFTQQRQELQWRMAKEQDADKKARHVTELARLYVANGFGHEAIGLLRMASDMSKTIENDNEFRALRGMAAALTGDVQQAEQDLKIDSLQAQPAAKLWLGYAFSRNNQWQAAHNAFLESGLSEESFPEKLRTRLILAKAEANLFVKDPVRISRELRKITDLEKLTPSERAAYQFINASLDVSLDRGDQAAPVLKELADGKDRLYGVKAQLAYVTHGVANKTISLDDAIEDLERLRFSWRGDRLEIDVLRQLGHYYIDNKNYSEGLSVWRQAASLAQSSEDIDAITENMQATFRRLYVDGDAKEMPPLQAVALFERFRELTPSGDAGRVALSNLAERLAAVDLLDQADELLSKQLDQVKDPEILGEMGAKLARWRLLGNDANGALDALNTTISEDTVLSDELSQKRLLLRARALADTGDADAALMLLSTARTDEALGLKTDINWRQNRWGEALGAMQGLAVSYRTQGKTETDGPMPPLIMKMAIALTLDGNRQGMELLVAQYGEYMAKTDKAGVFDAISKPSRGGGLADLETLKNQIGEAELYQQFLKNAQQ